MLVDLWPIERVKPYERNPGQNDGAVYIPASRDPPARSCGPSDEEFDIFDALADAESGRCIRAEVEPVAENGGLEDWLPNMPPVVVGRMDEMPISRSWAHLLTVAAPASRPDPAFASNTTALHNEAMSEVTRILSQMETGDPAAAEQLLPLVYDELRKLAAAKLAHEKPGQTLQATALVHEAYLRLVDQKQAPHWNSRGHFFGAAAEAIRRILVERARAKRSEKRGGHLQRLSLETIDLEEAPLGEQLLLFNDALAGLEAEDAEAAGLVKLRYFAGLSVEEAGAAMGLGRSAAYDQWTFGRAWLRCRLDDAAP